MLLLYEKAAIIVLFPIYKIFWKLSNKNSSENIKRNYELAMVDKQIHLIYDSDNTLDTS